LIGALVGEFTKGFINAALANNLPEQNKTLLLISPTAIMHFQKDTREIAELLKAKGMASLDLSLPIVIVVEEPTLAKSIGEIDVLSVYNMINHRYFASIDLAGLEKYRFRHNKRGTVKAVTANRKVKLMDTAGRMVFITNPNVFFPIVTYRKKTMSNLASFHGFKKLPPEIRHRIWTIAAEPRQLVAIEVCAPSLLSYSDNFLPRIPWYFDLKFV
jgi:hypothetical protein